VKGDLIGRLVALGFSEYEAKAYVALLRESPVTGYQASKRSGVPRSMIYEVLGKLVARGAAMTLRKGGGMEYAPVPAGQFFDQLHREHEGLVASLKSDISSLASISDLDHVWNIEGHENVMARAEEMIGQASDRVYLALLPSTFLSLQSVLADAVARKVRVVLYTTGEIDLPGSRVVVAHVSEETLGQARGLGLILVADGQEVLIGEWLTATQARASWTRSSLLVFIAEHHLRTDLYLPQILARLGDGALDLIHDEDRELFARAMESTITP
jgi:Cd2+/Zn2+-exporting ATPase